MTSARLRATGLSVLSLAAVLAASSVSAAAGPRPRAATATPDADPASGPVVQWTREAGTPWSDYLLDVAVDARGAITAVGSWADGKPTSKASSAPGARRVPADGSTSWPPATTATSRAWRWTRPVGPSWPVTSHR